MRTSDWNFNSWGNKINGTPKVVDKQSDWCAQQPARTRSGSDSHDR